MVLAAALGLAGPEFESDAWTLPAVEPNRVALIGVRSLDPAEREFMQELGVCVHTMSDLDRNGVEDAVRESLEHIAGPGFVHVSLDMDALDPDVAPGVGTPIRGGLSYREAHLVLELVAESGSRRVAGGRRGEPDPRPRERDRAARRRARRERSRGANSLETTVARWALDRVGGLLPGVPVDHVAPGHREDHGVGVRREVLLAHQSERRRVHDQERHPHRLGRRRFGRQLP